MKAVIFNIPTTGHVDPSLALAAGLHQAGHEVIYYLTGGYRERVIATGASYRETPTLDDHYFDAVSRRFNPVRLATQLLETTHQVAPPLVRQMMKDRPEVIIYDSMCPWGHVVARLVDRPAISSMTLLEVPPTYLIKARQLFTPLKLLPRLLPWLLPYRSATRQVENDFGLKPAGLYQTLNWPGDLNICYTSPEIFPGGSELGPSYVFTGPPITSISPSVDFPFAQLQPDRPLIYVSLGTVFNNNPEFFRACITAFRHVDVQVVMAIGHNMPIDLLGQIPPNFIVRKYVPQLEILARSDLFITHGGVNSVHQGLYYGVPLLLIPQQLEQALVAARLAELGAGRILHHPTAPKIREAGLAMLQQRDYQQQAGYLGDTLRAAGGVSRAVAAIEKRFGGGS